MSFVDHKAREINCKIAYAGPAMGGKSTSARHIYGRIAPERKSKLICLESAHQRWLFFDITPRTLGDVHGLRVRLHLYVMPGVVTEEAERGMLLKGADGVVFVADSQVERFEANVLAYEELASDLAKHGQDIVRVPLVFQWNKRDLPSAQPVDELERELNRFGCPSIAAIATKGVGVFEALRDVATRVVDAARRGQPI